LAALNGTAVLMGGGTDVQLRRRQRLIEPETLVALRGVAGLKEINTTSDGWIEIGAATSLTTLASAIRPGIPMIAEAIDTIASPQIRQMATLGGNLIQEKRCWFYRGGFNCFKRRGGLAPCYAIEGDHRFHHNAIDGHRCQATTPSDLGTVLLALEAQAVIVSPVGERIVPMADFYTGPGETVVKRDEILRAIRLPPSALSRKGAFTKLRLWEGDFAIVSAAITTQIDADGRWQVPRIVLGALASTPWCAFDTEKRLAGQKVTAASLRRALDAELDTKGHPLARNAWKLDAAAGIAEAAVNAILAQRELVEG
jgi:CO/xanthine dehydrogenase FAD-binding subunit